MSVERPPRRWPAEPCPAWCVRTHKEDDDPEDRLHQSEGTTFTAAVLDSTDAWPPRPRSTDVVVLAARLPAEAHEWVRIEECEGSNPQVVVSAESARRLFHALGDLLAVLDADRNGAPPSP